MDPQQLSDLNSQIVIPASAANRPMVGDLTKLNPRPSVPPWRSLIGASPLQQERLSLQEVHEKVAEDQHNDQMSIAKLHLYNEQARTLLDFAKARADTNDKIQRAVSGAAAIDSVSRLDPTDPQFEKQYYDLASKHADALSDPRVQRWFLQKKQDFESADQAAINRASINYSPQAAKTYQDIASSTGDANLAKAYADGAQAQVNRAKVLAASPQLSPTERATIFDPTSKQFNLDPATLDALEVQAKQRANAVNPSDAAGAAAFYSGVMKAHGLTADTLNQIDATPGVITYRDSAGQPVSADTVQGKTDKYNASVRLGNTALDMPLNKFNEMMQTHHNLQAQTAAPNDAPNAQPSPAPAPAAPTADEEVKRLLGIAPTPAPTAQPVAAATSGKPDESERQVTDNNDSGN
jgi:hypothetical protein